MNGKKILIVAVLGALSLSCGMPASTDTSTNTNTSAQTTTPASCTGNGGILKKPSPYVIGGIISPVINYNGTLYWIGSQSTAAAQAAIAAYPNATGMSAVTYNVSFSGTFGTESVLVYPTMPPANQYQVKPVIHLQCLQ